MAKVGVAMSGGTDSSVAAFLLKEQGHSVFGVTMRIQSDESAEKTIANARAVADALEMPHHVIDLQKVFAEEVANPFCLDYLKAATPNPCILCNYYVKFGPLLTEAQALGAEFMATGHYARVEKIGQRYLLRKGADTAKDQSYFLYRLSQDQLARVLMPLGEQTKEEARQVARREKLPVRASESQDICFIPGNDYAAFVERQYPGASAPGPIVDREGNFLCEHRGMIHYTIGQRRGLGISAAEPLYVLELRPETNTIVVGPREGVYSSELVATDLNWIAVEEPRAMSVDARIRYAQRETRAFVEPLENGRAHVRFEEPQMAITPGQSVVFYDGEVVVGGGRIEKKGFL